MTEYKKEIEELCKNENITKLFFDNILIRDNWTAIHYRYRRESKKDMRISVGDRMEFFEFKINGVGNYTVVNNWIQ